MGELDFQLALVLQHRFEQEYKSKREEQLDCKLAQSLQEQFDQEAAVEKPSSSLVYDKPKRSLNSSKCLTDPSWELVDPTPDIHALFIAFDHRFFWNTLTAVCVSWSKRMTTCAGICSYHGRGGLCSITLSEPLLKLRPRKDLVETLLHEMIHAYLFVTDNNKDRDGHGPEFHRHMFRINKESGTKITVYHSFHDEVRLYQQHWWRCNGPCQSRKPFFGMVRRAINRAPGPNDRWWAEHSSSCCGSFIKVKEPEKKTKPTAKTTNKVNGADIRNFISVVKPGSSNVKGFKDLGTQIKGKYNSASTIVVTKNNKSSDNNSFQPTIFNAEGTSRENVNRDVAQCSNDFLAVRNHWANKFANTNKRPTDVADSQSRSKILKTSDSSVSDAVCPICNLKIPLTCINSHLDDCLNQPNVGLDNSPSEEAKECPLCSTQVKSSIFDEHVEKCILKIYDGVGKKIETNSLKDKVSCLACGKQIVKDELNLHLEDCMNDIFVVEIDATDAADAKQDHQFNCPFCLKLVEENNMKEHIDTCLSANDDDILSAFEGGLIC